MSESAPEITKIVERNINTLLHRKRQDRKKLGVTARIVEVITRYAGSIGSVFVHAIIFGIWIIWNAGFLNVIRFDPHFIILAMVAAVEAIFLTIFVLIGQKYTNAQADKWAELDLQVSLLTEHEVTRILSLVSEIAKKMNIEIAEDKEIEELSKDIHPDKVLDTMEKASK